MKIQVGKTYKDAKGREVYIEHQLSRPTADMPAGVFLGISLKGTFYNFYKENGESARSYYNSSWTLLPNTVKKEGWIAIKTTYPFIKERPCSYVFESEAAARRACLVGYTIVKVEWEEEES